MTKTDVSRLASIASAIACVGGNVCVSRSLLLHYSLFIASQDSQPAAQSGVTARCSLSLSLYCALPSQARRGSFRTDPQPVKMACERTKYDGPFNLMSTMDAHSHPFNLVLRQLCN
jgi:hypothetical protein